MKKTALVIVGLACVAFSAFAANEISASFGVTVRKGYLQLQVSEGVQADMTGDSFDHRTTSVTTNPAALTISADIGTPGIAFFKNNSTNQTILVGVTGGEPFAKLLAGEIWQGRIATNALTIQLPASATTNSADLESIIIEE